jgi:hypothetical protein
MLSSARVAIVTVKKQYLLHILSVSVGLVIQYAKRMRRIIYSSVISPTLQYLFT